MWCGLCSDLTYHFSFNERVSEEDVSEGKLKA